MHKEIGIEEACLKEFTCFFLFLLAIFVEKILFHTQVNAYLSTLWSLRVELTSESTGEKYVVMEGS